MTCNVISTGARKGNAVLLNGVYLFDCGVPYAALKPYLKQISLIFLTHVHSDHFNPVTIQRIHRKRPLIRFVCARNMIVPLASRAGVSIHNIIMVSEDAPIDIPGAPGERIGITVFPLLHDVENVGYLVEISGGDQDGKALYATDTHHIPICAPNLDLYMIEANYRAEDMERRMARKTAEGAFQYESSVKESHMSMETAVAWLRDNANRYTSKIVFLHGHIGEEAETVGMD